MHETKTVLLLMVMSLYIIMSCTREPAQEISLSWQEQSSGLTVSLRGASAVNASVAWISGAQSSYAITVDGGKTWQPDTVASGERLDFRDIQAFDENIAYMTSAGGGERSRIYKTVDGGTNWQLQFTNPHPDGFFNSMAFWDLDHGIVMSDPVGGRLYVLRTSNGGETWQRVPPERLPPMREGEYGFAASGTNLVVSGERHAWIATGGSTARVFRTTDRGESWTVHETPIISNTVSSGIFSLAFKNVNQGVIVGGDYNLVDAAIANAATTRDGGASWQLIAHPETLPFRSCAQYIPGTDRIIAIGPSGSDYSADGGLTWSRIDTVGYHTMSFGDTPRAAWAAGSGGRVAKLLVPVALEIPNR